MSTYANYNRASHDYDKHRVAVGADVIAAMIQFYKGKPLKELHILDAGCGTGNYAKALLEIGVGELTLLDSSSGMLEKANDKLSDFISEGIISNVVRATMPPLPFQDDSFDAVMFNVVLNHLDRGNSNFPNSIETIKESRRVLRTNGVIVVSAMLASAAERVAWFSQLNTELTKRFTRDVLPSLDDYEKIFDASGIKCVQKMNILGSDIYKDYNQLEGPLDESWRAGSTYWSFATDTETEEAIYKLKELKQKGELEKWVKAHDLSATTEI